MSYTGLIDQGNSVCLMIDENIGFGMGVGSRDRRDIHNGAVALAKVCKLFGVPLVVSNDDDWQIGGPLLPALQQVLDGTPVIVRDPLTMKVWENEPTRAAVERTGRKKLVLAGVSTEVCVLLAALDAINDGYEVYVVTDACGGVKAETHEMAFRRMANAGAAMTTWITLACELQLSWDRTDTVPRLVQIVTEHCRNWGDLVGFHQQFGPEPAAA